MDMALWAVAAIAAFFVKGLCGFANTLVFTTILGFGNNNISISPVELALGYPSNLILAFRERRSLRPKIFVPLSLMVLGGSAVGAFFLRNVDAGIVKAVFGVVVIGIAVEMAVREHWAESSGSVAGRHEAEADGSKEAKAEADRSKEMYRSRKKEVETDRAREAEAASKSDSQGKISRQGIGLSVIGVVSGVFCGLFGIGALLAAYVGRVAGDSREFKANLSAVFIAENTFRIFLYCALGIITKETLLRSVFLYPCMLAGLFLGIKSSAVMNEKFVRKAVVIFLVISGAVLLLGSFRTA